jgi:glycerol uptake facilitator-like aquaporin
VTKKLIAEFLGTAGLLIVVVGSGIMGETLAQGNAAIALLANSLATGAGLYALIQIFGPVSGAHFNPVVSFVGLVPRLVETHRLSGSLFSCNLVDC